MGLEWGLYPMSDRVTEKHYAQRDRGKDHLKIKTGILLLFSHKLRMLKPSEAGREKEGASPGPFRQSDPADTLILAFWFPEL